MDEISRCPIEGDLRGGLIPRGFCRLRGGFTWTSCSSVPLWALELAHPGVKRVVIVAVLGAGLLVCCLAPAVLFSAVVFGGSSGPTALAEHEIPGPLLSRYERSPACRGLAWQVVAAIGYVESRHGTVHGAHLDPVTGEVAPPIVGVALDGNRTAVIRVPAGGSAWHGDARWDHAVGPMQFVTATWARWGVDASGDGVASPHNAYDAIAAVGRYLCNGRAELVGRAGIDEAIGRYNAGMSYLRSVLDKAYEYGMTDGGDPVIGFVAGGVPSAGGPQVWGDVAEVVRYALAQVGDPYVWGAEGPAAFDCSGLTMMAYRQIGIRLPHRSDQQVRYGVAVDWLAEDIRSGDLVFLRGGSPAHDYGHVGVALDSGRWVVAPRAGEEVQVALIPRRRVQVVRRIVT